MKCDKEVMEPLRFHSKKDAWVTGLLWVLTVLMFAECGFVILLSNRAPIPLPFLVMLLFVPLFFGLLIMSILFLTWYDITSEHLAVRMGLFHFRVPLTRIARVTPTRNVFVPSWGFALSFDRLHVWYRKKNGKVAWLPIAISPENQAEFLRELIRAAPNVQSKE
jgi:hypothetical protein